MKIREEVFKVVAKGKTHIERELERCYRRIEYLEGKEFYESILNDYKKQLKEEKQS